MFLVLHSGVVGIEPGHIQFLVGSACIFEETNKLKKFFFKLTPWVPWCLCQQGYLVNCLNFNVLIWQNFIRNSHILLQIKWLSNTTVLICCSKYWVYLKLDNFMFLNRIFKPNKLIPGVSGSEDVHTSCSLLCIVERVTSPSFLQLSPIIPTFSAQVWLCPALAHWDAS